MNRHETELERFRRERNERFSRVFVWAVSLTVAAIAIWLTAWDAGRDYGHREAMEARDKGISECASNQAGRKGK